MGPSLGRVAWRAPKGNFWYATPVAKDGRVYTASPGSDVIASCLDEKTGKVLWNGRQFGSQIYNDAGSIFAPVVTSKNVLITTGWWQPERFLSLDARNGKTTSTFLAGDNLSATTKDFMVYKHNRWNVILADGNSGKSVWRFEAKGRISGSPRVAEGKAFFGQNARSSEYYAVDQKSGEPAWQIDDLGWATVGSTSCHDGRIFVGTESGKFYGIDAATGVILWKHRSAIPGMGFQPRTRNAAP